jgi:DNA-binding SARP family transcriptional activator/tetratricopeptide (TPR) repeat protein
VLAVLLVEVNRTVSVDQLVDRVWGDRSPAGASGSLYSYVSRLRRALVSSDEVRIERKPGGYRLTADPAIVDVHRFHHLVERASASAVEQAVVLLDQALVLWRGEAFANLDTPWLNGMRDHLERERLAAQLERTDLRLRAGEHAVLVAELVRATTAHPLNERVAGQLMLALYRSGRPADALSHYDQIRRRLADEVGVNPGSALRQLHSRMLAADPGLSVANCTAPAQPAPVRSEPAEPTPAPLSPPPVPHQLPTSTGLFVGRTAGLAWLDASSVPRNDGNAGVTVVTGTAGVGKTALVLRWARHAQNRFPDGQLWIDLRGYDVERPVPPEQALIGLLHALGVPDTGIPQDLENRACLYRSLLYGRKVLVVLDNAHSPGQVRPLLPSSAHCVALVTSRDDLAGLVARDGATRLRLERLGEKDANSLLHALLGPVADEDLPVVEALARLCARLPLALRIAAERVVGKRLSDAVAELTAESPLDALTAGDDPHTALRAVFSWSYDVLPVEAAELFRRVGLHPGQDVADPAVAALAGSSPAQVHRLLGVLAAANLVERRPAGRVRMHGLLRAYAGEQAEQGDTEDVRQVALSRLLDHYLHNAASAMDVMRPYERHVRPRVPSSGAAGVTDAADAAKWLETERANLAATVRLAAERGFPRQAISLSGVLSRYLHDGAHHAEARAVHGCTLRAARATHDRAAEAAALNDLGLVHWASGDYVAAEQDISAALELVRAIGDWRGQARALHGTGLVALASARYADAEVHLREALDTFKEMGDEVGSAAVLDDLGLLDQRKGRYAHAFDSHGRALSLRRGVGDRAGEARTLAHLGTVHGLWGGYERGLAHCGQALALAAEIDDRVSTARALAARGRIHERLGEYVQAFVDQRRALAIVRTIGDRAGEVRALADLADLYLRIGRPELATRHHRSALGLARRIGARSAEVNALNGLGETDTSNALTHHREALILASELGEPHAQARALAGLGQAAYGDGDVRTARDRWRAAVAIYTRIGAPEAYEVASVLASVDSDA